MSQFHFFVQRNLWVYFCFPQRQTKMQGCKLKSSGDDDVKFNCGITKEGKLSKLPQMSILPCLHVNIFLFTLRFCLLWILTINWLIFHPFQIASLIILSLLPVAFSQNPLSSADSNSEENVRVKRAGFSLITGAIQVSVFTAISKLFLYFRLS